MHACSKSTAALLGIVLQTRGGAVPALVALTPLCSNVFLGYRQKTIGPTQCDFHFLPLKTSVTLNYYSFSKLQSSIYYFWLRSKKIPE